MIQLLALFSFVGLGLCQRTTNYDDLVWEQIPGTGYDISARGDQVWVIDTDHDIKRLVNNQWDTVPFTPTAGAPFGEPGSIAITKDGDAWVATDTARFYHYDPATKVWTWQPGWVIQASAASKSLAFGQEYSSGLLYNYKPGFAQHPADPEAVLRKARWVAIGEDGVKYYIARSTCRQCEFHTAAPAGKVYRAEDTASWKPFGGLATTLDVKNSTRMTKTIAGDGYFWQNNAWKQISHHSNNFNAKRVVVGDSAIYAVSYDEEVWRAAI